MKIYTPVVALANPVRSRREAASVFGQQMAGYEDDCLL